MTDDFYNAKYSAGDFKYNPKFERVWLQNNIIEPLKLKHQDVVLDLGCGKGLHASLLSEAGLDVFGIEKTIAGVMGAKARGSRAVFIKDCASNLSTYFDLEYFDLIYCRGMSWFHRELHEHCDITGVNVSEKLPDLFKHIKSGGHFVLQITSDFSGSTPSNDVHNNRLSEFVRLFEPHGEIVRTVNWSGVPLENDEHAAVVKGNLVITVRKK